MFSVYLIIANQSQLCPKAILSTSLFNIYL
jgi:hypothetical protein